MNKVQQARLEKITEAGTLRVTKLNAADHVLRDAGLITIESVPNSRGGFAYMLSAVVVEADDDPGCEGHESLSGAIGETVFCDGSCVQAVTRSVEADAQAGGAMLGRKGRALIGNCPYTAEAARLAFTHGWMTHHESCDCKISGGIGYTFDLATHTMIKNPPARQYTQSELDRAARRRGYIPATWRSKHKGSKARRVRSHA